MSTLESVLDFGHVRLVQVWAALGILAAPLVAGCASASSCGSGFRLEGDRCVFDCGDACGAHQECVETVSGGECQCVAGYAGDPCAWTGGLRDPGFTSGEIWSDVTKGASVLPFATGPDGPGIASFESSVVCRAGAVAQTVEMPRYEDAEPFVIEVTYRSTNVLGVDVGYGRAFRRLQDTAFSWETDRFCLGEAGYGGPVKFQVAAFERAPDCNSAPAGEIEVNRFEILVADPGECPAPGAALNAQAELEGGGWQFDIEDLGTGVSEGGLMADVGESSTSGARIYRPAAGENLVGMHTVVSVPLPGTGASSPALRFWWKGKPEWWYLAHLGTYPGTRARIRVLDVLFSDGTAQVPSYCLPPWTYGNVVDLSFTTSAGRPPNEAELVVDNIEVFSDPRCGSSGDLLDPSFDSAPNRWPGLEIAFEDEQVSAVTLIEDAARARPPGEGALEIRYGSNQARLEAQTWVWVPPSNENQGPELVFHSNVPENPGVGVFWALGSTPAPNRDCEEEEFCPLIPLTAELPMGGDWRRNPVCLPPEWAERWFLLRVVIRPSDDPLEVYSPPRAVLLDDFEVGTSARCPAD